MRRLAVPLALAVAATIAVAADGRALRDPGPLTGEPLSRSTDLRLLVADDPPFLLDLGSGGRTPLAGVPALERGTVRVVGVGGRAAVVIADGPGDPRLYGVSGRDARVAPLGGGTNAWPAASGDAVWIQSRSGHRCLLRGAALDGKTTRPPRRFPCATVSDPAGGSLGLVVGRTRVVDPLTARVRLRTRAGIVAVAGTRLVLRVGPRALALLDTRNGAERVLRWPSSLPHLGAPVVDPGGRYVALAFVIAGARQALDVWLLDTRSAKLTQLPSMPALVAIKGTTLAWTSDGRLVLLGESEGRDVVALWRPGWRRLQLKRVALTKQSNASGSFAPLR